MRTKNFVTSIYSVIFVGEVLVELKITLEEKEKIWLLRQGEKSFREDPLKLESQLSISHQNNAILVDAQNRPAVHSLLAPFGLSLPNLLPSQKQKEDKKDRKRKKHRAPAKSTPIREK